MSARSSSTSNGAGPAEVVAGLLNDGSAEAVARVAADLSRRHGAPIRFVHVVPLGARETASTAQEVLFSTALRSLRHGDKQQVTFESPNGDAARTLLERSRKAVVLVVGEDDAE
ncbi:MAG: universal stress protein, partial [Ornithinimicrobium sp.]